ncbi:hypothetical protein ACFL4T_10010, partial [candidate division KSB1 bacterium]
IENYRQAKKCFFNDAPGFFRIFSTFVSIGLVKTISTSGSTLPEHSIVDKTSPVSTKAVLILVLEIEDSNNTGT